MSIEYTQQAIVANNNKLVNFLYYIKNGFIKLIKLISFIATKNPGIFTIFIFFLIPLLVAIGFSLFSSGLFMVSSIFVYRLLLITGFIYYAIQIATKKNIRVKFMLYAKILLCLFIVGGIISGIVHYIEKSALLKNNGYIIRELRKEKRYEEAFFLISRLAQQGNKSAQFRLGYIYENPTYNEPVQKDIIQAFKWYRLAAMQDSARAQYALGRIYFTQIHDYKEAFIWFEKAAKQKHPSAMVWLADMYNEGLGTEKNHRKSIYWHVYAAYGKFIADTFFSN